MRAALLAVVVIGASPGGARADPVDELERRGEELAKQGEWTQAIDTFKAADAAKPRASHACLIGLAYLRREQWAQAELYLTTCHERANAADPLPSWIDEADAQLRTKLATSGAAPVAIAVAPADAHARIKVSGLSPDESFTPRMIHLAPGRYSILVSAPGYQAEERTLVITDAQARVVTFELRQTAARNGVPILLASAGLALVAGGFAYDEAVVQPIRSDLASTKTIAFYEQRRSDLATARGLTIAMWSVGGTAILTGLVLRATVFARHAPQIEAAPVRGGAVVSVEWSR